MKIYEILSLNKELLQRLSMVGIRTNDYQYVELYHEFMEMIQDGNKTTYAVAILSEKYAISERKVYGLIRRFSSDCKNIAV
jgi:hypothetical protein